MSSGTLPTSISKGSRSRTGCAECRRLHRKCDEARPTCRYCREARKACVYTRSLSFLPTGHTSRRRKQRNVYNAEAARTPIAENLRVSIVPDEESSHLITAPSGLIPDKADSDTENLSQPSISHDENVENLPLWRTVLVPTPTGALSSPLQPEHRSLLHYFVHSVSHNLSSYDGMRQQMCSVFLPMAMEVDHVRSALLSLTISHRQANGLSYDFRQAEFLRWKSTNLLGSALSSAGHVSIEEALATTLMLCMMDAVSSERQSWRVYLRGASALLDRLRSNSRKPNAAIALMEKLHNSLLATAMCCGIRRVETPSLDSYATSRWAEGRYVDDIATCSTSLFPVWERLNTLGAQVDDEAPIECQPDAPHFDCQTMLSHRSHMLYDEVRGLIQEREMVFHSEQSKVSEDVFADFDKMDEAYHHVTILQIWHRGRLSVPYSAIRESIQTILDCVSSTKLSPGISGPGVAATPALFAAGQAALVEDQRKEVLSLLRKQWMCCGMGNIKGVQSYLQRLWAQDGTTIATTAVPRSKVFEEDDVDYMIW